MAYDLSEMLVVGISSRALFDLDAENRVFDEEGMTAYRAHQREHEEEMLEAGTGFPLVRALLRINDLGPDRLVEVIVISRNDADSGIRIFNSIEAHGLDITRGAFTDGGNSWEYVPAFQCDLFLSAEQKDVKRALGQGVPAALVLRPPEREIKEETAPQVRIAFDGDAVLFDAESERVYQVEGLDAFLEREAALAHEPMSPGPFEPFLRALTRIQQKFDDPEQSPIRTSLVTARNAPAHKRVVNTLRSWGVRLDETFFLGGMDKAPVLKALRPHIFFDDQLTHLTGASKDTPAAHVPVTQQMNLLGDEALTEEIPPSESAGTPTTERGESSESGLRVVENEPDAGEPDSRGASA